ncbi:DUF58 domain-containing protein [Mangrovibacterium diazotrophicum]|uniref:Uncharacterized protein DUF58 n=1 Tax=Mangrovibacterium diazotrophicum TaxID=1261403 RepID=A0A419WB56_9BACT|nr:DUF58 domain-containing protein [Mangrovibacterium diazotrophicum]RKD92683.1 uncharacterized protein DUF58 [Mangrovibacterium diazotrophicum]
MNNLFDIQQFQQFDNLELIAREVVEGFITGLHRSPFHGFSVEFAEHRQYNQGEATKHIDWKLFARSDRLYVKQYEEETNLRCQLVLDVSSSMLFPFDNKGENRLMNKLAFSVYSAAALIYLMRKQRDAVGLTLFSDHIEFHSGNRISSVHAELLYGKLAALLAAGKKDLNKTTNTVEALHQIAEQVHKRSLVVLFSDMLDDSAGDELFSALQHLRYNKHEVILFHVTDHKQERELDFINRPYRFVDLETGHHLKLTPGELKDRYRKAVRTYFDELKIKCGQYQIDLVEADIHQNFSDVLLNFLLKRKRLF